MIGAAIDVVRPAADAKGIRLETALDVAKQLLTPPKKESEPPKEAVDPEAVLLVKDRKAAETLLAELHEQLAMLWQEYAQAPDEQLDAPARQLKQALLKRFTEATHAA